MSKDFDNARAHAELLISAARDESDGRLTTEMIAQQVERVLGLMPAWKKTVDRDLLIRTLEASNATWIGQSQILVDPDERHVPWLEQVKPDLDWRFWSRYRLYLAKIGWPKDVRDELDRSTDQVLGLLMNPLEPGPWDRRGLVVGHVQSGKTAHYSGLICKAVDAGYKVIIVLSGMHNNLRSQTQIRLEEAFLGYDISKTRTRSSETGQVRAVGVGLLTDVTPRPNTITDRREQGDFRKARAEGFGIYPGTAPLLFVVKKNGSVLRNLLDWIDFAKDQTDETGQRYIGDVPLLVIDDESDQASIDTTEQARDQEGKPDPDHNPTVINNRIRVLLRSFAQSAYIGYTATPFANIFIHERGRTEECGEDLFPRSFIVSLPAPSDYIGAARIFGLSRDDDPDTVQLGLPIVREVTDHAESLELNERHGWMPPKHKITHLPRYNGAETVPPSLRTAIYSFILSIAARRCRGGEAAHNSMLIHVTRFNHVQTMVRQQVEHELTQLRDRVRHCGEDNASRVLTDIKALWEDDFVPTTARIGELLDVSSSSHSWHEILPQLRQVLDSVHVREINGTAGDTLEYKKYDGIGLNVVAIGGDKLSRGLTLEGLTVSYFLRASRMYDTLMQMSRWFGYRPGYTDLCRLFTAPELRQWFEHIAMASEELREEFDRMVASGGTPREYGHRVRSHPQMLVTSRVKMRNGHRISLSFDGDVSETVVFHRDARHVRLNFAAVERLAARLDTSGCGCEVGPARQRPDGRTHRWDGALCWSGAASDDIVRFLDEYKTHPAAVRVNTELLRQYILRQVEIGDLTSWTVLVAAGRSSRCVSLGPREVRLVERAWHGDQFADDRSKANSDRFVIRRLVSPRDEAVDIESEAYGLALAETRQGWAADPGRSAERAEPTTPAGWALRQQRPKGSGLLLIYPLDPSGDRTAEGEQGPPVIGIALSFPGNPNARTVEYIVNNVYFEQEMNVA